MSEQNTFTHGPLGQIFLKTALPIILVMSMNGLLTVVDAMFLGRYVGADALGAVTLIFPLFMLIIALATLVANGMSSILARNLGAGDMAAAHGTFAGAHGLALAVSALLIVAYLLVGAPLVAALASGDAVLAEMARTYLVIMVFMSPLAFLLGVHSDALRNEGRIGFMAAMSLLVSLSNIGFNYVLIALAGMGVAGSALGTAAAQLLALLNICCGQIDIGNAESEMVAAMKARVPDLPTMAVEDVARTVLHMADLPLDTNMLTATIMANRMPYVGRG